MIIALALTRNLYQYLPITIYSIKKHNPEARIIVFAEDDKIENVDNVIKIENNWLTKGDNISNHWTYMSLVRLYLNEFITADKILWLDVDTICLGSLQELWDIELKDNLCAMAIEPLKSNNGIYCNSGVALINLKKWQEERIDLKCKELLESRYFRFKDQDCMNIVCKDRILELDSKFNASPFTKPTDDIVIKHYAFRKGWDLHDSIFENYKKEWLESIEKNI